MFIVNVYGETDENLRYQCVYMSDRKLKRSSAGDNSNRLQIIANIATTLIALFAIALSVWEGSESRRYNRLSVLPQLEPMHYTLLDNPQDTLFTIEYSLDNSGLGPAVLEDLLVFYNDSLIFQSQPKGAFYNFDGFREDILAVTDEISILTYSRKAGQYLRAGKEHLFFNLEVPVSLPGVDKSGASYLRNEVLEKYSFVFCYCSIYEEDCKEMFLSSPPPTENNCSF